MPPELQALVKERGVKSCKDLEKLLRDRKRHNWVSRASAMSSGKDGQLWGTREQNL